MSLSTWENEWSDVHSSGLPSERDAFSVLLLNSRSASFDRQPSPVAANSALNLALLCTGEQAADQVAEGQQGNLHSGAADDHQHPGQLPHHFWHHR